MKTTLTALALLATSLVPALATDLSDMAANPATISVTNAKQVPLVVSTEKLGWAKIPPELAACKPVIFAPTTNAPGFIEFEVLQDGYVLIACNFGYQGNASGGWKDDAWSADDFDRHGWEALHPSALTGSLIRGDNLEQTLFFKLVQKGETYHLRCNKYYPPYPILLQAVPPAPSPSSTDPAAPPATNQ